MSCDDDAAPAIGADQVTDPYDLGPAVPLQRRGHPGGGVLLEADQGGAELDPHAQVRQPLAEDLLGPPLRHEPGVRIRHVRPRVDRLGHPALPGDLVAGVHPHQRRPDPGLADLVQDPEVFENLLRTRLHPVAAGADRELVGPVDDPYGHAPAGQLDGGGQPGRPRSGDQHLCVHDNPFRMNYDSVNLNSECLDC